MESELYEAAVKGNVPALRELLAKDKLLLDRIMTGNQTETPLHIASMLGHLDFVEEVLARKPEMAREQDSQNSTPLHLAAAKGDLNIVTNLLRASPEMCFVCDKYERNPLHVAAMKGHVDVLEHLVRARPDAARSVVERGQTILHLCVKHNRLEALKLLIDILGNDQLFNSKDEDGNTILQLAAADRQTETIDFLINKGVSPNITNSRGFTAFSLLAQSKSNGRTSDVKDYVPQTSEDQDPSERAVCAKNTITASYPHAGEKEKRKRKQKWQKSMHHTLMVVATLLATVAYEAAIRPPGGLWQKDGQDRNNKTHYEGESIMASTFPKEYKRFVTCNTISFIASLSVIMLIISGLPLKRLVITTWIAMLTMWVAITFSAVTYAISVGAFTPDELYASTEHTVGAAVMTWAGLMALIFLCHIVRIIVKLVREVRKLAHKASTNRKPEDLMA